MKNVIKITESDLHRIIKETICKIYAKMPLNEFFVKRKDFVAKQHNLARQILENWCLINYCTLTGQIRDKEYWKKELWALIDNLGSEGMKVGNDPKTRYNAIREGFDEISLDDSTERVLKLINRKFKIENIPIDEIVVKVAENFISNVDKLIWTIANYLINDDGEKYINSI